jgi:uncharacterized protein
MKSLIGNTAVLRSLEPREFVDGRFGLPTVTDILSELEKPGRDPRPAFKTATFTEGVETLQDLQPGMLLEGVVTNVAAFGAFVDVGVHQDGLVHISAMSNSFVKDPRDVVKPGDVVRVRVLGVDVDRKRISLTLRLDDAAEGRGGQRRPRQPGAAQDRSQDRRPDQGQDRPQDRRPDRGQDRPRDRRPDRPQDRSQAQGRPRRPGAPERGAPRRERERREAPPDTALADALRRAGYDLDRRDRGGR